jgi:hypothetical protein
MLKSFTKPQPEPKRVPFEGVDLREAGRRGGVQSGISRRMRAQRELEAKILESRNGAAQVKLLEMRQRRERALEQEQIRHDRIVLGLMDQAEELRSEIDHMRTRRQHLERRVADLHSLVETDDGLIEALRQLPEARLEAALRALGHEFVDDHDVTDAAA